MIEIVLYTVAGIGLYFLADAALKFIERVHGEPLPHRSIVFFVIIFLMAVALFQLIRLLLTGEPPAATG